MFKQQSFNLKKLQPFVLWNPLGYNVQTTKFYCLGVFYIVNFFTPKFMNLGGLSGSFEHHFQIKLNIHGSNLTHKFGCMHILVSQYWHPLTH
jgi:hypothetical protein